MSLLSSRERRAWKQARFVLWGRGAGNGTLLPGGHWRRCPATRQRDGDRKCVLVLRLRGQDVSRSIAGTYVNGLIKAERGKPVSFPRGQRAAR